MGRAEGFGVLASGASEVLASGARGLRLVQGARQATLESWVNEDLAKMSPAASGRSQDPSREVLEGQRQMIGRPLGVHGAQIAATALEHHLTLITRSVRDFEGLGLTVFNP